MGRAVVTPTHNSLLVRLLPASRSAPTSSASTAWPTRSARSSARSSAALLAEPFGWRVPFFVFVIPTIVFVVLGTAAARSRAAATSSDGRPGADRGGHRHRRAATVVRRVGPHPLAGPHAAPHLVLAAVPRRVGHRPRLAHVALLRGGLQPLRVAARLRRRVAEPAQVIGILLGIPLAVAPDAAATRARAPAARRSSRSASPARGSRSRWRPSLAVAIVANIVDLRPGRAARARHLRLALARHPAQGAIARASRWRRCSSCPASSCCYIVGGIADHYGIRQGLLIMVPVFLIGALDPRRRRRCS